MVFRVKYFLKILIFLSIILSNNNFSQSTKTHAIGPLWETMFSTGSKPNYAPLQNQMSYPGGDYRTFTRKNLEGIGIWIGTANWTDKLNVFHTNYVSEGGFENDDAASFIAPISIKKRVRNRLPNVTVNNSLEERFLDTRASASRSSSIIADERIESEYATNTGVNVHMFSYALANQNHNSYIIREYTFTNDGNTDDNKGTVELPDQNLTEVYFGFQFFLIPGGDRGHQIVNQNDDWAVYTGNKEGDELRGLYYVYDGNADQNHAAWDDIGDPEPTTGEFLSTQYPGFGVLHADTSPIDDTDDLSQPSTVDIVPRRIMKSYTRGNTENEMYLALSSGIQSSGTVGAATTPYDVLVQEPIGLMSFGPYELNFGESVTIVLYEAVGAISQKKAIEAGLEWINGTLEFDGKTGDEAKNALIATGLDSLMKHAKNAEYAWGIGLENLPTPPPAPDNFKIIPGPGKIDLEWDSVADEKDWQTGELDFTGYRIYRAEGSFTNPYKLIATFVGDTTHYTDRDTERGKKYFYAVTAYDDGSQNTTGVNPGESLESSRYYNRNFAVGGSPFLGSQPTLDSVYVVPNPYHLQGLAYGGSVIEDYSDVPRLEDKLGFVGLPAKAIIRIFSMHGDLLTTLRHPNPDNPNSVPESADEEWYQITDYWQTIRSGVYVYYIEGWDLDGKSVGATKGKFVVIR
jgi:hypothetical protein